MAKNPWILPEGFDASSRSAAKALLKALRDAGADIPDEAFLALQLGDINAFLQFIDFDKIRNNFGDLRLIMESTARLAGQSTFKLGGVDAKLLFDIIDERAVNYAQERTGQLIVEITDQMRETVRNTIARATAGEMTFQQAAIRLQATIPLTPRDAGAVDKYIQKQFERFMRAGLSEAKARVRAQNMGARYASKLLGSRTRTIARTEIADAAMNGRYLGWESGVSQGVIAADSVKEWIAEPDACPICSALDGTLIGWNDDWTFPEGVSAGTNNRMPPAHPNCRCSVAILPPDFSENVFTPSSGGEMPEEADEFMKHLPGKHDQSTHGRKKSVSFDTSGYESLVGQSGDDFQAAMSGLGITADASSFAETRFNFRSIPAPEEFEGNFKSLDKAVNKFIEDNQVSIMTEETVLDGILADGEVKSIFAFDEAMKGGQYLEHRKAYERIAFGYDNNTPIEIRPVSGIVFPNQHNNELLDTFGQNYGSVQLVLNDDVKSRTTFTIGDSLDTFQRPTPLGGKVPRTIDLAVTAQSAKKIGNDYFEDKRFHIGNYVETQVHGGVKLSDINKIVFHYPMFTDMEDMTNRLNDMGISWEVVD
jgi:hypothetical protein